MPESPEIQRADPATRRHVLAGVVAVAAACTAGYFALQRWLAGLRGLDAAQVQQALERALVLASWAAMLPAVVVAAFLWRYGTRVCEAGRFPAPGARVIRDTPVLHGAPAQLRGTLLKVLAAFLALLATGTLIAAYRLIARLHA
ncbi:MAG TPA: hypothetical protein VJL86_06515 [Steroidobacteraceae bacterium]|nr:hypothetical protein [Steroidobacteraceae bacterium]